MIKKIVIAIVAILILWIAYYLISPLWRVTIADDASPLASPVATLPTAQLPVTDSATVLPIPTTATSPIVQTGQAQPRIIAQGALVPKEHAAEGTVLLIEQNGKKILRFENFRTDNGPDLKIYMSRDFQNKDYVSLGDIKATQGNVNYELPSTIDTNTYNHVLIWCEQFRVLFSGAELK